MPDHADVRTKVAELDTDVRNLRETVGSIQVEVRGIRTDIAGLVSTINNKFEEAERSVKSDEESRWTRVIGVGGIVMLVAGGAFGTWSQLSNNLQDKAIKGVDDRLTTALSGYVSDTNIRLEYMHQQMLESRRDDDEFRSILSEVDRRLTAEITPLHERTRYEQGKSDMDRQWEAEWRRMWGVPPKP